MAYFRVEGTSRVHWSLLVEAASENEAAEIARRTAGNQSELRRQDALQDVDHQVGQPLTLTMGGPSNGRHSGHGVERGRNGAGQGSD